ncbi:unnamed protein product [Litomosoides sigmodontis]|uniref:Uncharacterized protein n=1 Tax=Litomosoides sigmodontis TaxID=42156 RepID=A0A3P6S533_LITSI|nr:unnamed protein product [Litomosoides sigmodontis]
MKTKRVESFKPNRHSHCSRTNALSVLLQFLLRIKIESESSNHLVGLLFPSRRQQKLSQFQFLFYNMRVIIISKCSLEPFEKMEGWPKHE